MPPLLKIRTERGQMSAIERRIADFILDNAHLLRDYSSQQLASALISQSSVVKFSQKLGFRATDLKYSIGQDVARAGADPQQAPDEPDSGDDYLRLGEALRRSKAQAEEETPGQSTRGDRAHRAAARRCAQAVRIRLGRRRPVRPRVCHAAVAARAAGGTPHRPDPDAGQPLGRAPGDALLVFSNSATCPSYRSCRASSRTWGQDDFHHPAYRQPAARMLTQRWWCARTIARAGRAAAAVAPCTPCSISCSCCSATNPDRQQQLAVNLGGSTTCWIPDRSTC